MIHKLQNSLTWPVEYLQYRPDSLDRVAEFRIALIHLVFIVLQSLIRNIILSFFGLLQHSPFLYYTQYKKVLLTSNDFLILFFHKVIWLQIIFRLLMIIT